MNQKKVKFNIIDIIVILALLAGAAFLGVRMFGGEEPAVSNPATGSTYHVTFYAECVREDVAATLVQGSKSENASRNMDLGKLVDFTIGESIIYTTDSKGAVVQTSKPGYVSVTLVCEFLSDTLKEPSEYICKKTWYLTSESMVSPKMSSNQISQTPVSSVWPSPISPNIGEGVS